MAPAPSSISSALSVAIIHDRTGYLSRAESDKIQTAIHKQIISEACSIKQDEEDRKTIRPLFKREPNFVDGALNMWCENDQTLAWLMLAVSKYNQSLVVKSQSEIQKRHICRLHISDKQSLINLNTIEYVLSYQNPWIEFKRWEVMSVQRIDGGDVVVFKLSLPEDQVMHLMKAKRCLSIGLTTGTVDFVTPYGQIQHFPQGWDTNTEQFIIKKLSNRLF